jgi:hypothetical protein
MVEYVGLAFGEDAIVLRVGVGVEWSEVLPKNPTSG